MSAVPAQSNDLRDISIAILTADKARREFNDYVNGGHIEEHHFGKLEARASETASDLVSLLQWAGVDVKALAGIMEGVVL